MKTTFFLRSLWASVLVFSACDSGGPGGDSEVQNSSPKQAIAAVGGDAVKVELAPFNKFPQDKQFPLVFRFSQTVAPFSRAVDSEKLLLSPKKLGWWKWESESELRFTPSEAWAPGETFDISFDPILAELRNVKKLSPVKLQVKLPTLSVEPVACSFEDQTGSPVTRIPVVQLRSNYPLEEKQVKSAIKFSAQFPSEKTPQAVQFTTGATYGGLEYIVRGAKIFRPKENGAVEFKIADGIALATGMTLAKGVACSIPVVVENWNAKVEKAAEKVKPIAALKAQAPSGYGTGLALTRAPLRLDFLSASFNIGKLAFNGSSVPHGKPAESLIERALTLSPPVKGTWKADEYTASIINFTPTEDWPVGETITVTVDPNAFPDITLRASDTSFVTPKLTVASTDTSFYSDPTDPSSRKIVSSIRTNFPLKDGEVERLLSVKMRVEPEKTFDNARNVSFTAVRDGKDPSIFHIQTENIKVPEEPAEARLTFSAGAMATKGGAPNTTGAQSSLQIPSRSQLFRIVTTGLSVVKKNEETLERVASVEVSEGVAAKALAAALEVYLLPDCAAKENKKICQSAESFGSEELITDAILKKSTKVEPTLLDPDDKTSPTTFNFRVEAPPSRELFLRVKNNLTSTLGYPLTKDYRSVLLAEEFPRMLSIMHEGSLLSLSGSRKLGVASRNVGKVEFELARILPRDVHHLVSVTSGNFAKPYFEYGAITLDQLAERKTYQEFFTAEEPGKAHYSVVDFDRFMAKGNAARPSGLFLLTAREIVDEKKKKLEKPEAEPDQVSDEPESGDEVENGEAGSEVEEEEGSEAEDEAAARPLDDKRLVLLTDLGSVVKDELDGTHQVFVVSFKSGLPVAGASVKLLGQNGEPIFTATSNAEGRATIPSSNDFKAEKKPLMYAIEKGEDYSFLPFKRYDRQVNVSSFNTSGVVNREESEGLRALLFSDRGIYRPGEEAKLGIIVRKRNLETLKGDIPVELVIRNPRGTEIVKRKLLVSQLGFEDFKWSSEGALTGTYWAGLSLIQGVNADKRALLGSTSFRVDEFQPDKLTAKSVYQSKGVSVVNGWLPQDGKFQVSVLNLFGTPAGDNKVLGTLLVKPWEGTFASLPGYRFYTDTSKEELPNAPEQLGEQKTDAKGEASFEATLSRFNEKALHVEFAGEAFEKESGRSVIATTAALVSNAKQFVGWKADGSLDYITKGSERKISILAVGPDEKPIALPELKIAIEKIDMVSVLVKQPNGTLQYELSPKRTKISDSTIAIPAEGFVLPLGTSDPGSYSMKLTVGDESAGDISYTVLGEGNTTFASDRSNEIGIRLKKSEVLPDEELEVSINTPYVGSGLLTIEREKVFASVWFKTNTLSSIQKIKVPRGVVGNAYVSVAFVRSLDSKDIFMSPMAYGVKPFSISKSEYTEKIELTAAEKIKPGSTLDVHYKLAEPSKFLLYAVDEGILQFARYKNPEPVGSFVPKRALEVDTYQILDLLLPDYKLVQELSSPGGDEDVGLGKFKNPFARKKKAPVVFWSGILPAGATEGTIQVPVPDYFNGTLRIVAVAVAEKKVGVATAKTIVQSDFVLQPQLPYFVSPGDVFEATALIANAAVGSGADTKIDVQAVPSAGLEVVDAKVTQLVVPEGQDRTASLKLRAKDILGEQKVVFKVKALGQEFTSEETISVRPPVSFRTELQAGYVGYTAGKPTEKTIPLVRQMHDDKRVVTASISESPLSIGRALVGYLKEYPYGCTEQVVSAAMPSALFGSDSEMALSDKDVERFTKRAFQTLSSRQLADGSFSLWDAPSYSVPLFSIYATHFLHLSKDKGFDVPASVLTRADTYLKNFSKENFNDLENHFAQSYALYVRASSGEVIGREATAFSEEMNRQWQNSWKESPIALFLAGTFKILQMDKDANALLKPPPTVWSTKLPGLAGDPAIYGSVYAFIASKYFDEKTWLSPYDSTVAVAQMIEAKRFNSFTGAFSLLGLKAIGNRLAAGTKDTLHMSCVDASGKVAALATEGMRVLQSLISKEAAKIAFSSTGNRGVFYDLRESGFDKVMPKPIAAGLTITRELRNEKQEVVTEIKTENKLEVTLFVKADEALNQMAVVELVPGGFEIDLSDAGLANRKSLHDGPNTWNPDFIDVQEDRILFFGRLPEGTSTFTYRLKPVSRGAFSFAPAFAEGMYDSTKRFFGELSKVEVK